MAPQGCIWGTVVYTCSHNIKLNLIVKCPAFLCFLRILMLKFSKLIFCFSVSISSYLLWFFQCLHLVFFIIQCSIGSLLVIALASLRGCYMCVSPIGLCISSWITFLFNFPITAKWQLYKQSSRMSFYVSAVQYACG